LSTERAVFFDLDGTLLDRRLSFKLFVERQLERFAATMHVPSRSEYVERAVALDRNGFAPREELFGGLAADFHFPTALVDELVVDFRARFASECLAFQGSAQTLASLKGSGVRLGLITNGSAAMQEGKIEALGFSRYFDAILISELEGVRKPEGEIFQRAARRLAVDPANAVHVGDNPDADVRGAKASGMRAIWIRDDFWPQATDADHTIDRIDEVPSVVASWAGG
jgi:putative hydrolase of the HAD superfamily